MAPWSWLLQARATGTYVEMRADGRTFRALPQHKVVAALAAAQIAPVSVP
jgi:hypothetical protein